MTMAVQGTSWDVPRTKADTKPIQTSSRQDPPRASLPSGMPPLRVSQGSRSQEACEFGGLASLMANYNSKLQKEDKAPTTRPGALQTTASPKPQREDIAPTTRQSPTKKTHQKRRWLKATFQETSLKTNYKVKAPKRRHSPDYKTKPHQEDSLKQKVDEGHHPKDKFKDQLQVQSAKEKT